MNAAMRWLDPIRTAVPEVNARGWHRLDRLAEDITALAVNAPPVGDPQRAAWLLRLRQDLASAGHRGGPMWQTLAQFVAGFHDLDLRDATGAGHGAMVIDHAPPATATAWKRRLNAGALMGVAATERRGGSRIQEISTRARLHPDGRWRLSGEKCWVSRLADAHGFVVFFRDPDAAITAAIIEAERQGLTREPTTPAGLGGWTWGMLRLDDVPVDPDQDLVGGPGGGLEVFRRHFTAFRPLVTATAIGTAAGVHTLVAQTLAGRRATGVIDRVRDNALMTLGRAQAELTAALLTALHTSRLAITGHRAADLAARVGKAAGVDVAHRTVAELAPLVGAAGFAAGSPIAKARNDLTGLLYADGIHDALYRSGGLTVLAGDTPVAQSAPPPARRHISQAA